MIKRAVMKIKIGKPPMKVTVRKVERDREKAMNMSEY